jgi:uncharacterized SAM-binding protein YcdF (DUF218 family)
LLRFLGVLCGIFVIGWAVGLHLFAESLPKPPTATTTATTSPATGTTDAIVVLTGGSGRLNQGLDLLGQGQAKKLFVSGVYHGVDVEELLRVAQSGGDSLAGRIALGHEADDTIGNAAETAKWLRNEGYASLRLVTAAYHMPRSLFEFRLAMPDTTIVPHPVFPTQVRLDAWWRYPGTASLLAGEYSKFLLAHARIWVGDRWRDVSEWLG